MRPQCRKNGGGKAPVSVSESYRSEAADGVGNLVEPGAVHRLDGALVAGAGDGGIDGQSGDVLDVVLAGMSSRWLSPKME